MNYTFSVEVAKQCGVEEAVMLENIHYWIIKNKANNKHYYDNNYWTYNSVKAFTELFPFWSYKQVRRILSNLENKGFIKTGNYNQLKYDQTKWYCITESGFKLFGESIINKNDCPNENFQLPKTANRIAEKDKPIPYINTDNKPNKDIYIDIYEYYLSLELIKHKSLTPAMKKAIDKAMKENKYSVEDCKELLDRHKRISVIMKDNPKFKIRTLHEFFGQKIYNSTNLICTQYDIGGCYYNMAIENIEKEKPKEDVKQTIDVEAIIQRLRGEANV